MRIAIIGSNSFIASYVIEELHNRGHEVVGLQRHMPSVEKQVYNADEIYLGDITNAEVVERVVSISDHVINLAGILGTSETVNNPLPAVKVNIEGTLNVLNACRVWEKPFLQIAVGNHWMNNTYSITRTTAERFTLMYAKEHGLKANVIRALNAYGPRQTFASYKKMMPGFILNALKNQPIKVYGDGQQVMDFIHARDLAKFFVDTLLQPEKVQQEISTITNIDLSGGVYGNVYQAGEGDGLPVQEIAEIVKRLCNSESEIINTPMRQGEPEHARIVADYKCPDYQITLEEGIKETIEWYRANIDKYSV